MSTVIMHRGSHLTYVVVRKFNLFSFPLERCHQGVSVFKTPIIEVVSTSLLCKTIILLIHANKDYEM